jgi:hypothetical protein
MRGDSVCIQHFGHLVYIKNGLLSFSFTSPHLTQVISTVHLFDLRAIYYACWCLNTTCKLLLHVPCYIRRHSKPSQTTVTLTQVQHGLLNQVGIELIHRLDAFVIFTEPNARRQSARLASAHQGREYLNASYIARVSVVTRSGI